MAFLDWISNLFKPKTLEHALKWPLPEERFSSEIEDAEQTVGTLRRFGARFLAGGEFDDVVYRKAFGEGVYAYFIVRTDKKTGDEKLIFDGYMLQEEERLNIEVESGFATAESLAGLGYEKALERSLSLWSLSFMGLSVMVYAVDDFGDYIEVAVPPTKFAKQREAQDKTALSIFEKLQINKDDLVPLDVITLQIAELEEAEQAQQAQQPGGDESEEAPKGGPGGFSGEFKLGK
ncbi:MAG TPA: hypothetical protein VGQ00_01710 [Candidatus Norongarragalinales archaeon]|jgi:adenylate cyclase class IV|nr:hypothetical protein [Candidatus Norongarragalinales archaeon]